MAFSLTCDGIKRRDFLKVGALGAGPEPLRLPAPGGGRRSRPRPRPRAAIFINLTGGPSHMDTFDLKPNAPAEFRGAVQPDQDERSRRRDQRAPAEAGPVRRQVRDPPRRDATRSAPTSWAPNTSTPAAGRFRRWNIPATARSSPRSWAGRKDLPPFVAIPNSNQRPGFLGVQYAPLNTTSRPAAGPALQRPRHLARQRPDDRRGRAAQQPAGRPRQDVCRGRVEQPAPDRPRPVHRAGPRDHHQQAGPRGVRRQQGIAGVRQAVRRRRRSA